MSFLSKALGFLFFFETGYIPLQTTSKNSKLSNKLTQDNNWYSSLAFWLQNAKALLYEEDKRDKLSLLITKGANV